MTEHNERGAGIAERRGAYGGSRGDGESIVSWAERVYIPKPPVRGTSESAVPALDGYRRKTPVQQMRVPEDYNKRMAKRAVAVTLGILFAAAVVYVLLAFVVRL